MSPPFFAEFLPGVAAARLSIALLGCSWSLRVRDNEYPIEEFSFTRISMDPLDDLKRDHSSILEQLYALDKQLGWLESSGPERVLRILSSLSRISKSMWKDFTLHIQREEGALYPVLESRLGYEAEAVTVMRREHQVLVDCLFALKSEISMMRRNPESLKTWGLSAKVQTLRAGLSDHVSREERVLFWLAELHLSEIDKRKIFFELMSSG